MCDRILCPLKISIRRYCNEGNDVVSAKDMHTALKERPVKGTTASVCSVQEQHTTLEIAKIFNFNSLHNFQFTEEGLRVWKAYNVGPGKFIPWNDIVNCFQKKTDLLEEVPFFLSSARQFASTRGSNTGSGDKLYECPELSCTEEFQTQADLDLHMNMLDHHIAPLPVKECLYDKLKRDWVHHFQTLTIVGESSTGEAAAVTEPKTSALRVQMGWALHTKSASVRFSQNVRQYLTQKFNIGQDTDIGNKILHKLLRTCEPLAL